ncbi:MAG TPA: hypothetical protein VK212_01680 [Lentimicrobium sp.]|nr:hypothetical protein [Lentimicrobium sp.]
METHKKSILHQAVTVALVAASLLLIPLIAMQFNEGVNWTLSDFVVAWVLLFGAGFSYALLARKQRKIVAKAATALTVGTGLFLVWSNLAVGIIGNENNPINLAYFAVLAFLIVKTILANFQVQRMVKVLYGTAIAQIIVTIIALLTGQQHALESSVKEILMVNAFFVFLWIVSALLYEFAARQNQQVKN